MKHMTVYCIILNCYIAMTIELNIKNVFISFYVFMDILALFNLMMVGEAERSFFNKTFNLLSCFGGFYGFF